MRAKYRSAGGGRLHGRAKAITFISILLLLGALLPAAAHAALFADLFSALSGTANAAEVSPSESNTTLQTIALPKPAQNYDPTPARGGGDITIVGGSAVVPEEGPSGTIADIEKPANSTVSTYIVRKGDTVASVAQMFQLPEGTILTVNDLPRGATLKEGQELIILSTPEIKYTVKKGDTIESIAKATGGDVNEIAVRNGVDNATLAAGQHLYIPNGEVPAAPETPAKKKTAVSATGKAPAAKNNGYYISPLGRYVRTQGIHGYNGVDMGAPQGTSIRAAASGVVTVARSGGYNGGYGNYVVISHSNGSQTLYAHMSSVAVSSGERVAQGEVIGYVGNSGRVSGPTGYHLHFEIRNGIRNPF